MQVTVKELNEAVNALAQIINRPRMIPMMAKFRVAKLHAYLVPFYKNHCFNVLNELTKQFGEEQFEDEAKTKSLGWAVTPGTEKYKEFTTIWDKAGEAIVDVGRVTPLPLSIFGNNIERAIEASEFVFLGPFVVDDIPSPEQGGANPGGV